MHVSSHCMALMVCQHSDCRGAMLLDIELTERISCQRCDMLWETQVGHEWHLALRGAVLQHIRSEVSRVLREEACAPA